MKKRAIITLLMLTIVFMCSSLGSAGQRYYTFTMIRPYTTDSGDYQDDNIAIHWETLDNNGLRFRMKNLTDKMIYTMWDQCIFVGFDGIERRDRKANLGTIPATPLRPNKEKTMAFEPVLVYQKYNDIYFYDGSTGYTTETYVDQILPLKCSHLVGKTFGALLTYKVGGALGLGGEPRQIFFEFLFHEVEY